MTNILNVKQSHFNLCYLRNGDTVKSS